MLKGMRAEPGKTIDDTFKGVGAIFGEAKASMSATDPHKESVLSSVTGGATARRKLAFNLGVDRRWLPRQARSVRPAPMWGSPSSPVAQASPSARWDQPQLRTMLRDKTAAQLE